MDVRLMILQTEAGSGKNTALAELAQELQPVIWYQANEEDNDPLIFLLQLCYALQHALPAITRLPAPFSESWDGRQGPPPWRGILDQIINVLWSGRPTIVLPTLTPWRAQGEAIVLDQSVLTFTKGEIAMLFGVQL